MSQALRFESEGVGGLGYERVDVLIATRFLYGRMKSTSGLSSMLSHSNFIPASRITAAQLFSSLFTTRPSSS
jgi:hypothetical protein